MSDRRAMVRTAYARVEIDTAGEAHLIPHGVEP